MIQTHPRRLHELEQQFSSLESKLVPSPGKEAISVLHGMLQEVWRSLEAGPDAENERGFGFDDIANLYRRAPKMEGTAVSSGLSVGESAPEFALPDASGQEVRLSDYRGQNVLLVFYPLDWSPGCSVQLDLYQAELGELERRGIKLLGISVDSIYSHGAWAKVRGLEFPLLADFNPKGEVSKAYNVYRNGDGFSERALFLVDGDGIIRYSYVSPYLHHVPDIYELFDAIDNTIQAKAA